MKYNHFEDIPVWQEARKFVSDIYNVTSKYFKNDFELIRQLRRAAISIALNIAEGYERKGNKDFAHFLNIAKSSAGECRAILYIAFDLRYLSDLDFEIFKNRAIDLSRQLSKFGEYLIKSSK
jgi:four helix bundle protein